MTRRTLLPVSGALATAFLALALLLPAGVAIADDGEVTFRNQTRKTQHVLVRSGDGEQCSDKMDKQRLEIAPGESVEVAADDRVCWCHSSFGEIGDCVNWRKAKPGSLQRIR